MSKSKGNIVNPIGLLDKFGADPVRYWTATSRLGQDTAFSDNVLQNGKRLVTKLWNASRFVAGHLEHLEDRATVGSAAADIAAGRIKGALDQAILARLGSLIEAVTAHFEAYDYADALRETERFFWDGFCDNYLELVKNRAYGEVGDPDGRQSAIRTLNYVLDTVLRLFAPFIPFVTDELHGAIFEGSVHARGGWPNASQFPANPAAIETADRVVAVLTGVRRFRSANGMALNAPLAELAISTDLDLADAWPDLRRTINLSAETLSDYAGLSTEPVEAEGDGFAVKVLALAG